MFSTFVIFNIKFTKQTTEDTTYELLYYTRWAIPHSAGKHDNYAVIYIMKM